MKLSFVAHQIRKATKKPRPLDVAKKYVGTYSPSNAVVLDFGKEVQKPWSTLPKQKQQQQQQKTEKPGNQEG